MLHPSRRCLPFVLQVTLLPSTLLRNYTYVKLHVKHQCNPKNNPIGKTKKNRSQNSGDFVFYIEFSMHDFSQLLRRKSIKTSLSNFSLATEKRQSSTTSLSVSIFMRFLSTYLIIRHFCVFNTANCRLLLMFFSNTRSMKRLLEKGSVLQTFDYLLATASAIACSNNT